LVFIAKWMRNEVSICLVVTIIIIVVLVFFATQQRYTYAQIPGITTSGNNDSAAEIGTNNTTTSNFSTYENSQYGYKIQHPFDWDTRESIVGPDTEKAPGIFLPSVSIVSPGEAATLWVSVKNATQYLDTNDMKVKSKTPHNYVLDEINNFATYPQLHSTSRYIKDKPVILINNTTPAWELDYTDSGLGGRIQTYHIAYFMTKDNKVYNFELFSDPPQVPTFLPIVQKMINSFQITK
jgi:hypothetical protein